MAYIGKSPSGTGVRTRYYFTQTSGGGTSISGTDDNSKTLTFTDGEYIDVYLNGVLLVAGTDYNTTTANTVAGLAALASGDVVEVVVYDIFTVADTVSASQGGTFNASVTIADDLTVDTSTLHVDSTNNRVGVGNASPDRILHISGGASADSAMIRSEYDSSGYYREFGRNNSTGFFEIRRAQGGSATTDLSIDLSGNTIFGGDIRIGGTGSANALDDYEEGTWTPDLGSSVGSSSEFGKYTKVGDTVFIQASLNVASNSNGNHMQITNFPFTGSGAQGDRGGFFIRYTDYGDVFWLHFNGSNTTTGVYAKSGGVITYANMSGKRLDFAGFYSVP